MVKSFISKESLIVKNVIIGMTILLALLWVINPLARPAVGINLVFLTISFIVYSAREYTDDTIGVRDNSLEAAGWGILATLAFFVITLVVPGMSIGFPSLPASISDQLKFFLVVIVAPIVETIFFQGALLAYVSNFDQTINKKKIWRAVVAQALLFSIFHVGAYVSGFYQYPGFTEGFTAIAANISAFIVAFLFALIAGWIVTRDGIRNLVFVVVFHLGLNLVAYSLAVAVFLVGLPIIIGIPGLSAALIPLVFITSKYLSTTSRNVLNKEKSINILGK